MINADTIHSVEEVLGDDVAEALADLAQLGEEMRAADAIAERLRGLYVEAEGRLCKGQFPYDFAAHVDTRTLHRNKRRLLDLAHRALEERRARG